MRAEQIQQAGAYCRAAEAFARVVHDTGVHQPQSTWLLTVERGISTLLKETSPRNADGALWTPRLLEALCMCAYARGHGPPPARLAA
jgi:hypothetical protein